MTPCEFNPALVRPHQHLGGGLCIRPAHSLRRQNVGREAQKLRRIDAHMLHVECFWLLYDKGYEEAMSCAPS